LRQLVADPKARLGLGTHQHGAVRVTQRMRGKNGWPTSEGEWSEVRWVGDGTMKGRKRSGGSSDTTSLAAASVAAAGEAVGAARCRGASLQERREHQCDRSSRGRRGNDS
jgi:hypothetical protein